MAEVESSEDLVSRLIDGMEPGSFVTKWVVIAEVIDADGDRALICSGDDGLTRWDTYGLLTDALMTEKAHQFAARLDDGP